MCNFIRSNGKQCKLSPKKERCHKHPIVDESVKTEIIEQVVEASCDKKITINLNESDKDLGLNIEETSSTMSPSPDVNKASTHTEPIYSNVDTSGSKINKGNKSMTFDYTPKNDIIEFSELMDCWCLEANMIDHKCVMSSNPELTAQGYSIKMSFQNIIEEIRTGKRQLYFKSEEDREKFIELYEELDIVSYCVSSKLYDERLFKLCCMIKRSWFNDNNNLFNLAGMLYKKQHVDIDLMRKTYLCILHEMTDRFDEFIALKVFNDWETSKYHPKLSEAQIKSIAGGTDPTGFKEWKAEYEVKEKKEKKEKKEVEEVEEVEEFEVDPIKYNTFEDEPFYWDDLCKQLDITIWDSGDSALINYLKNNLHRVLALVNDNVVIKQSGEQYFEIKKFANFSTQLIHSYTINKNGNKVLNKPMSLQMFINVNKKHFHLFNQTLANYHFDNTDPKSFVCSRRFIAKQIENFETDALKTLLKYVKTDLFSNNDMMFEYEMDKLAIMCKYPHLKTEIITLLISKQGCGKNLYTDFLCDYVFGSFNCIDNMPGVETLLDEKNGEQFGKKLIIVNEMSSTKDKFMASFNKLKGMVTEKHQRIRMMYMNGFMAKQATEYYCLSNHKNSYVIESSKSRREFVPDISEEHADDRAYWGPIRRIIKNQDCGNAFYSMLMARPITYDQFMSKSVPMSETKQEIVNNCKSDKQLFIEEFIEFLNEDPNKDPNARKFQSCVLYAKYRTYCESNGCKIESLKRLAQTLNQLGFYAKREASGMFYTL